MRRRFDEEAGMTKHLWGRGNGESVWLGLLALGFALASVQWMTAQDQKPDATQLVLDCMKMSNSDGDLNILWWVPEEFWRVSAASNPNVSPAQLDVVVKVIHPYTIVGVSSGKTGPFAVTYRTEAEVRNLVRLKDSKGNSYSPLPEDQVDPSVPGLFAILKPAMARTGGAALQNTYFFAFPGSTKDGTRACDPTKEGFCEVDLGARQFKWRLPLGSLLPKQRCPTCGEILSGAYKFCPYDGTKLAGNK
jgi:hypothetical protein